MGCLRDKHHCVEMYGVPVGKAPRILDLGSRLKVRSRIHVQAALLACVTLPDGTPVMQPTVNCLVERQYPELFWLILSRRRHVTVERVSSVT
jgi:hypothetical protein